MQIFVQLCPFLSDQTGTVHVMGTLNGVIKNCAYLRKEVGKTSLPYPKFIMCVLGPTRKFTFRLCVPVVGYYTSCSNDHVMRFNCYSSVILLCCTVATGYKCIISS